ncbi:hypothetical protein [Rhodocyclus tenuis]|uniref:Uncharacterized protein n=1 Tax=Rhodocyclus tenuis TaxID=1066 RepID=A0A840G3N2_RHOTE|nr:hypothetical protein [Rhodocyclus tenuis]MBB4249024.1 hypothetical protein [Rhodocyclus tenuis]
MAITDSPLVSGFKKPVFRQGARMAPRAPTLQSLDQSIAMAGATQDLSNADRYFLANPTNAAYKPSRFGATPGTAAEASDLGRRIEVLSSLRDNMAERLQADQPSAATLPAASVAQQAPGVTPPTPDPFSFTDQKPAGRDWSAGALLLAGGTGNVGETADELIARISKQYVVSGTGSAQSAQAAPQPKPQQEQPAPGSLLLGTIARRNAETAKAANYSRGTAKVEGPGTRTSDSVPAMLSRDEAVLPGKTVACPPCRSILRHRGIGTSAYQKGLHNLPPRCFAIYAIGTKPNRTAGSIPVRFWFDSWRHLGASLLA